MVNHSGTIVLMGSGELTASMVEVHKALLRRLPEAPQAVFLDTPAGFQLNVDQISARAVDFFQTRVLHPLRVASFKSKEHTRDYDRQQAGHTLRQADFILIGPGSPTYAVRQWQDSAIPDLLADCVTTGGCLVAASAAALTMGRFTLPVYEIYKVGQDLHWVDGLNLLGRFDLNVVVVPHWNNAEGGTHDTRFCFMGEKRFAALEAMLPQDIPILGLDEHTACILDLTADEADIKGIGGVILRTREGSMTFQSGERFPLSVLREGVLTAKEILSPAAPDATPAAEHADDGFWRRAHDLSARFHAGLDQGDPRTATNSLLEFDRLVWQAQQNLEDEAVVTQARDTLRDMIVLLGNQLAAEPTLRVEHLQPLVDALLTVREKLRREEQWDAADMLRDALSRIDVQVEDTPDGHRWRLTSS